MALHTPENPGIKTTLASQILVFLLLLLPENVLPQSIVTSLPGFSEDLPFKMETGYVGVGENEEVQLFYTFVESERNTKDDPLLLWLAGGPGCSGYYGVLFENGPLRIDYESSTAAPRLEVNPYSWTKVANVIYIDAPVGTGFSYATSADAYNVTDTLSAQQSYIFLRKWLIEHPRFLTNPLYVGGVSYSGIIVPLVVTEITKGNDAGSKPHLNLMGYILGNPLTDQYKDPNARIPFAHLKGLIPDERFESTKRDCKGRYSDVDPRNIRCREHLQAVAQCLDLLDTQHILEPSCRSVIKPTTPSWELSPIETYARLVRVERPGSGPWCRNQHYFYGYAWLSNIDVQNALHVREGTINDFVLMNRSLSYTYDVPSVVDYHQNLTNRKYQVLIYSGDHDIVFPYVGTFEWIKTLGLSVSSDWRPWFVDGQVAGYTTIYASDYYYLTYATVKGAGHAAPEYKPMECLQMIERWFAFYPL